MKSFKRINFKSFTPLALMFVFFIPIDMVNGEWIRNDLPSLSAAYKLLVMIFVSYYLLKRDSLFYVITIFFIILIFLFLHSFFSGDVFFAISGLDMMIKFYSIIIFYLFFVHLIEHQQEALLYKIAFYAFIFLLINIMLGALGFGYGMYGGQGEDTIGTRGFIYAGNELGVAFIASGSIILMKQIDENKLRKFLFVGVILIVSGGLLASKGAILGAIFLMLLFPVIKAYRSTYSFKISMKAFIFSTIALVTVPVLASLGLYLALYESRLLLRLSYFYGRLDITSFIFSSRNLWAKEAYFTFINDYNTWEYLFGTGRAWRNFANNRMVEIDPIDFLMNYGAIGFLLTFGIIFFIFLKMIIHRKRNRYSIYIISTLLLLLGMSFTAGHVFNSGTAGFLIGIVLAYSSLGKKKEESENPPNL